MIHHVYLFPFGFLVKRLISMMNDGDDKRGRIFLRRGKCRRCAGVFPSCHLLTRCVIVVVIVRKVFVSQFR